MTRNPFYNAAFAAGYIALVATFMNFASRMPHQADDSFLVPMAMLALLVLSAALMACIFFYQPVTLYLDGKHQEAIRLVGKTIGIFAVFTLAFLAFALFLR